jgi:hypothetical protein
LLRVGGLAVVIDRAPRPRVPAIMLSDNALSLIRDVFAMPALFADLPRIRRRVVAWGENAEPVTVPHSGVVVSETMLLESLAAGETESTSGGAADFSIYTSRPLPSSVTQEVFGTRRAAAVEVSLRLAEDSSACWIEATSQGWLFLIPNQAERAWLLAVGGSHDDLLAESRLIAPRIQLLTATPGATTAEFPACPRMISPLAGDNWLACGSAAMAFDPICGDGTANAVREAVLGCAVIRAIAAGSAPEPPMNHYRTRLLAGMQRHLAQCGEFYRTGGTGAWWQAELAALRDGFQWCERQLAGQPEPQYRLHGFELEPVL